MKAVTLDVSTREAVYTPDARCVQGARAGARISFATPDLPFGILTAKRWELIRAMTGAGRLRSARRHGG